VIIHKKVVASVKVLYYLPDYNNLVQEFFWQTLDISPHYFRIHRFLNFWHHNIDAIIKEVEIASFEDNFYKNVKNVKGEYYYG